MLRLADRHLWAHEKTAVPALVFSYYMQSLQNDGEIEFKKASPPCLSNQEGQGGAEETYRYSRRLLVDFEGYVR